MRLALLSVLIFTASTWAEVPSTQPVLAPTEPFRSVLAGLEYTPPPGGMADDHPAGDLLGRYTYANDWEVRIRRIVQSKPILLSDKPHGILPGGLLETFAEQLKLDNPSAEIVTQKRTPVGDLKSALMGGLIVARYNAGSDRIFSQQVIVGEGTEYFLIQMVSPTYQREPISEGTPSALAQKMTADMDAKLDSVEKPARMAFNSSLRSIRQLDRAKLIERSRTALPMAVGFFVQAHKQRIIDTLVPQHFERVIRDGKDIGYTQVDERVIVRNGNEGIEITVRSTVLTGGQPTPNQAAAGIAPQANNTDTYFMSFDRDHEIWSKCLLLNNGSQPQVELGGSDRFSKLIPDRTKIREIGAAGGGGEPAMQEFETTTIDVRPRRGKEIELKTEPKHYLSQTLGQLLVRLISREPGEYEFSYYVGDTGQVMARWVTVERAKNVKVGQTDITAIAIIDRIGFEGPPTTHYVTPAGDWLGTVTADNKVQVLPAEPEELKKLWDKTFVVLPLPPVPADPIKPTTRKADETKVRPNGLIRR